MTFPCTAPPGAHNVLHPSGHCRACHLTHRRQHTDIEARRLASINALFSDQREFRESKAKLMGELNTRQSFAEARSAAAKARAWLPPGFERLYKKLYNNGFRAAEVKDMILELASKGMLP